MCVGECLDEFCKPILIQLLLHWWLPITSMLPCGSVVGEAALIVAAGVSVGLDMLAFVSVAITVLIYAIIHFKR